MIESRGGRLWTQDDAGVWRVRAQLNSGHAPDLQADDPLAHFLGQSGWIMDIDAWRDGRRPEGAPVIPHWLKADPEAWVMMAISVQSSPVALVQLQSPLAPIPIDWETRDLLKAAGQQAAGLLRMEQVLESLVQARQFESFNRMSAFVVHDLKNLVAQLGLMLRNADRHRDNPEFQADMLDTVANAQQRMQSMLLQLRAGTQPIEAAHPIDLDACLKRVVTERSWPEPGPQLDLRTHEDRRTDPSAGPKILGHPERLERVVGHLIQNGIDASPSTASVRIIRRMDLNQVVIEVMDQGCGMTEQFIEQELFRPFRSTKAHGMGIGAFESREYIREIGGDLSVRSLPDRGTSFEIRLPVWSEPA
jgi:putative PEP-CTERM system histidine kinase